MTSDATPSLSLTDLIGPRSDQAVREVERRCRFFVRRFAPTSHLARVQEDDVVQEALMAALGQARKIAAGQSDEVVNVDGWLCRVTTNAVRRMWRRERGSSELESLEERIDLPAPQPISQEKRLSIRRALQQLDPKCRQLLLLRDVEGEERREMARRLGISANALGVRLHRCRRRLLELYLIE
ncbi:MAG: sigma-70 family RNA polymerase sigma factor [bacterium]|nr:sigma-70 family RNA polymerase sigma factor [bacterium]